LESISIKNAQYSLDENITINHNIFGDVEIQYSFYNVVNVKFLAYKYTGYNTSFEINWDYVQESVQNQIGLEEYLNGSLDFIYGQIKYLYDNKEQIKDLEEEDVIFLDFFKDKIKQQEEQKPLKDLRNLK